MFRLTSFKKRLDLEEKYCYKTRVLYLNTSMHTHLLKCCFNAQNYPVNGSLTRDFRLEVFSCISFPRVPEYPFGAVPFRIFTKIRVDFHNFVFVAGVVVTDEKLLPVSLTSVITPCLGFSSITCHRRLIYRRYNDIDSGNNTSLPTLKSIHLV
jgi:hypothetical protein